jgi:hypothetical protein
MEPEVSLQQLNVAATCPYPERNDLYSSPNITYSGDKSIRMRLAGHVARMGDRESVYMVFIGEKLRKDLRGRPGHRWEDNVRWILRMWGVGGWTGWSWLRRGTGDEHL